MSNEEINAGQTPVSPAPETPVPVVPVAPVQPPVRVARYGDYGTPERVLVPLLAVVAYLFARWVVPAQGGIGIAAVDWMFCGVAAWYVGRYGGHTRASIIWLIFAAALGLSFALYAPSGLQFFAACGVVVCAACSVYAGSSGHDRFLRDHFVPEMCEALFVRPFSRFGKYFCALGSVFYTKRRRPSVWWAVLGVAVALPLTCIICALLVSDSQFARVMGEITDWLRENVLTELVNLTWRMAVVIPVALYLFGMLFASRGARAVAKTPQAREAAAARRRCVPQPLVYAVAAPPLLVYLVFIFSQIPYYFAAFSNIVPEGQTYAEYARSGFFELCIVAAINLGLLLFMEALCRRREDGTRPLGHRIVTIALSVMSLVLLATAARKLVLYINAYGLSRLRVYAAWLMVLLAAVFVILIVCQFVKKVRPAKPVMFTLVVCALVLLLSNPDRIIAEYNVAAYRNGLVQEVDVDYLENLSDAAVPALVKLAGSEDAAVAAKAGEGLERMKSRRDEDRPLYAWNLQSWYADMLLQSR